MKTGFVASLLFVAICMSSGCMKWRSNHRQNFHAPDKAELKATETVQYQWQNRGVEIKFYKSDPDSVWLMFIGECPTDVSSSRRLPGEDWGLSASKCSSVEMLPIIEEALHRFGETHRGARIEELLLEMHLISDLWDEILRYLKPRLIDLESNKNQTRTQRGSIFIEVSEVLENSSTITRIAAVLRQHGLAVSSVDVSNPVVFEDSIWREKGSEIANLPGLGIAWPGVVELNFDRDGQLLLK